jgi:circadian clock protein KaiC
LTKQRSIPPLVLESTSDPELDAILGGGLPASSMTVVGGEPGTGKTILALQILFHAAHAGKKCIYFTTLSEPAIKVLRYMQQFAFFDPALIDDRVLFIDLGEFVRKGAEETLVRLTETLDTHNPDFVVIDSYRAIGDLIRAPGVARSLVYDLSVELLGHSATTLLVGEYTRAELSTVPELAVADGIIALASRPEDLTSVREVEIVKMRGADFIGGRHFYDITPAGLVFYPRVRAAHSAASPISDERESTGVAGLDALFRGGIPRSSATIFQGATGAGKTLLSLQFILEGARSGQPGVFFTLEETPDQLRRHVQNLGFEISTLERDGLVTLEYASPVELSTDRFLNHARKLIKRVGAQRVALDSLSTLALGSERRFRELAYALAKHAREAAVTLVVTVESPQLLGAATLSAEGVSFIADNLVQLRYVELDGKLVRAISVLKARGIDHETELRRISITAAGIEVVTGAFDELRGVITGLAERRREPS